MKKLATAIGLLTLFISGSAMATWSSTSSTIDHVELGAPDGTSAPETFIGFATLPNSRPSCTNASPLSKIVGSTENIKAVTGAVTAAYLAGRPVRVNWLGCSGPYAQIVGIKML